MSAVVLLALPADIARADKARTALERCGRPVRFDPTAPASPAWREAVKRAMAAPGVMLFWSAAAHGDSAAEYRRLARWAIDAGKAISVRLDSHPLPAEAAGGFIYDLSGWRGRLPGMTALALAPAVEARERQADLPQPRSDIELAARWLWRLRIIAPLSMIATLLTLYAFWRTFVPTQAEETAWNALRAGPCAPLEKFRADFPGGVHSAEAAILWDQRITERRGWIPDTQSEDFLIPSATEPGMRNEEAARRRVLARAPGALDRACRSVAGRVRARKVTSRVLSAVPECRRFPSGFACDLRGHGECSMEVFDRVPVDLCRSPSR